MANGQLNIRTVKLGDSADPSKNFLINAPAVPDGTLTIERENGTDVLTVDAAGKVTMPGNLVPCFSAYAGNSQAVNGETLIQINTEEFDVGGCFDTSTYRFQPNVAGYYQINASFQLGTNTTVYCRIRKNGSVDKIGTIIPGATQPNLSVLVYMNGSTDYLDLLGYAGAPATLQAGPNTTYFQGYLVKAA